jgi:hypothetical protein
VSVFRVVDAWLQKRFDRMVHALMRRKGRVRSAAKAAERIVRMGAGPPRRGRMLLDRQDDARTEVEAFGEKKSIAEWSLYTGLDVRTLKHRLSVVPPEIALSIPRCARLERLRVPCGEPASWTWECLPWQDAPWAQAFVDVHPDGATLELVGEVLGITRERVRQIEEVALRKLRRGSEGRRLRSVIVGMRDGVEVWGWRARGSP